MSYNYNWSEHYLEDVGKIITGKTPKTSNPDYWDNGDILFLTPSDDMTNKYISDTKRKITDIGLESVRNCHLPEYSICVSCIGSDLGKVVINKKPCVTNQQINSIICNENCDVDYIYYILLILGRRINYLSNTSTAVPIINKSTFSKFRIKIPPLSVQRRIAAILSSLDDKIENNRKNLRKAGGDSAGDIQAMVRGFRVSE